MNSYLDAQCRSIIATITAYEASCELAATKDDGKISREEKAALKKIKSAIAKFKKSIEKVAIK